MQQLHRDARKREVCERLQERSTSHLPRAAPNPTPNPNPNPNSNPNPNQGVLWKRSGLPMFFFRRSAYISADGSSLVYRNSKVTPTLILTP